MTEKEIEEKLKSPHSQTIGLFHELYDIERYHGRALFELLSQHETQKIIVKNLLQEIKENCKIKVDCEIEIKELQSEKKLNNSNQRIDLYFEAKLTDDFVPVIIELKTNTDNHDGQLTAYYNEYKGKQHECFFYISLDGKKPKPNEEDEEALEKYKCMTYDELIEGISTDDIERLPLKDYEKLILKDYIETVNGHKFSTISTNSKCTDQSPIYKNQFQIYEKFFELLGEKLKPCFEVERKLCVKKDDGRFCKIEEKDIGKYSGLLGVYYTLKISKDTYCFAIEKKWEKRGEEGKEEGKEEGEGEVEGEGEGEGEEEGKGSWINALIYGIYEDKDKGKYKDKYDNLIKHWDEIGRGLYSSSENIKTEIYEKMGIIVLGGNTVRHLSDDWYVAQMLTDWAMRDIDNLWLITGRSDLETIVKKWIKEDFGYLC